MSKQQLDIFNSLQNPQIKQKKIEESQTKFLGKSEKSEITEFIDEVDKRLISFFKKNSKK